MRRCFFAAVLVGACVGAAPAVATPRVSVETVVTGEQFGRGGRCLLAGSSVVISGSGFVPGNVVQVDGRRLRPGRSGAFSFLLHVGEPKHAQDRVTMRARQVVRRGGRKRTLTAELHYWSSFFGVDVPGWNSTSAVADAVPGKVERARISGFDRRIGRDVYVHYVLDGRQVFAQRVARLRGPCGAADFRLVQFPFDNLAEGVYSVDFGFGPSVDTNLGASYPRVRIGPQPPPLPLRTTPLFTIAGTLAAGTASDGAAATASRLPAATRISASPDGGLLVADYARIRLIDSGGHISTVAGTGRAGASGDGGPAVSARIVASLVTQQRDGGFLIGECGPGEMPGGRETGRVRRVDPSGVITTVAGTGRRGAESPDGTTALAANLACPTDVAELDDGRILVADDARVRAIGRDGKLTTLAGNGEFPGNEHGGPALSARLAPTDLAPLPDGSILVADPFACHVYRLAEGRVTIVAGDGSEGRRDDDGDRAVDASVCPTAVAAAPAGGFYVADAGYTRASGGEARLRFVRPDGRIETIAGSGRFSPEPSRGDELRGDGMPATRADLQSIGDVVVLADGGIAFSEGNYEAPRGTGLVRYLPPASEPMLAVALRRDTDRIFDPGVPGHVTVSLSRPATVALTVTRGSAAAVAITRDLPAGDTRIDLPALAGEPHYVALVARDTAGRIAEDRAQIIPRGWLASRFARALAGLLVFTASRADSFAGSGLGECHRFAATRVDCAIVPETRCAVVLTLRLGSDRHLRWGTYRCPFAKKRRLIRPVRQLRRKDLACGADDSSCPPPLFGAVADRWLVPRD